MKLMIFLDLSTFPPNGHRKYRQVTPHSTRYLMLIIFMILTEIYDVIADVLNLSLYHFRKLY